MKPRLLRPLIASPDRLQLTTIERKQGRSYWREQSNPKDSWTTRVHFAKSIWRLTSAPRLILDKCKNRKRWFSLRSWNPILVVEWSTVVLGSHDACWYTVDWIVQRRVSLVPIWLRTMKASRLYSGALNAYRWEPVSQRFWVWMSKELTLLRLISFLSVRRRKQLPYSMPSRAKWQSSWWLCTCAFACLLSFAVTAPLLKVDRLIDRNCRIGQIAL